MQPVLLTVLACAFAVLPSPSAKPAPAHEVFGAVVNPGRFDCHGRATVLDAIVTAGGLTCNADPDNILLVRQSASGTVRLPIRYRDIVQVGDPTTDYRLQPGDRIEVTRRIKRANEP